MGKNPTLTDNIFTDVLVENKFKELREKFPDFNAIYEISNMLCDVGKHKIEPNSDDGENMQRELNKRVDIFCHEYEQYGIKPHMNLTWEIIK